MGNYITDNLQNKAYLQKYLKCGIIKILKLERGIYMIYSETFISHVEHETPEAAERTLQAIQEAHPASSGWVEDWSKIEQTDHFGHITYRAVRAHHKVV